MANLITILVLILIYIISFKIVYKDTQTKHSKGGEFEYQYPLGIDIAFTIIPFVNTVISVVILCDKMWDKINKDHKLDKKVSKFFKVSK